jgi:hypothetical protein
MKPREAIQRLRREGWNERPSRVIAHLGKA